MTYSRKGHNILHTAKLQLKVLALEKMTIIHDDGRDIDGGTNNSSNTTSSTNWIGWKERGTQSFNRGDYGVALQAYAQASRQSSSNAAPSTLDRQILLSNMVACRLKLGGKAQAEAAVVTAKKCIALNDKWAKAHVRLGASYIMLGGDESAYSNDACNALQRALQLDPGNPTARDMLVRELRSRDHRNDSCTTGSSSSTPSPSAPPQHMDSQEYSSPRSASANNSNRNETRRSGYQNQNQNQDERRNQQQPQDQEYNNIDESNSISWRERIQFQIQRAIGWYSAQSEGIQTVLKMFLVLVVLYVAFGGRFGLEYIFNNNNDSSRTSSGKYSTDNNVYEEFYRDRNQRNQQQDRHYRQDEDYNHQQNHNHQDNYDSSSSSSYNSRRSSSHSSSSWWDSSGTSSLLSGQYSHMLIIGGVVFVANRLGISPYQAIFFVNMLMGRRGGGGRRGRGFGGPGMMGGFGNMRHRPGGMWR
ncbi:MAG: hypothetical protein ACI90V_012064 [Bacillariaceae sp.]